MPQDNRPDRPMPVEIPPMFTRHAMEGVEALKADAAGIGASITAAVFARYILASPHADNGYYSKGTFRGSLPDGRTITAKVSRDSDGAVVVEAVEAVTA